MRMHIKIARLLWISFLGREKSLRNIIVFIALSKQEALIICSFL